MRIQRRNPPMRRLTHLTSLIDVVFLLLIYFMVTSNLTRPEADLPSALKSDRQGGAAADLTPQIIWVERGADGRVAYRLGARLLFDKASLTAVLRELPREAGVFVRGRPDVPWEAVAGALQACEDARFEKVTYVPAE